MPKDKLIETPEELFELFTQYLDSIKANPKLVQDFVGKDASEVERKKERPLTMEGFENFVAGIDGMPRELDMYFANRDNRYSEYVSICSHIRRLIRQDQIEGGMTGIYNPSITQRLNNLVEKVDTTSEIKIDSIDYDKLSNSALEEIAAARSK